MTTNPTLTEVDHGDTEIELPPMSLRQIQAQGGKIASSSRPTTKKTKTKRLSEKVQVNDEDSGKSPQTFLTKTRTEQGQGQATERIDEQLAAAKRMSTVLDEQLKNLRDEHGEMKDFIRDVLYTLNARGYESITDCRGELIDLNRCRGQTFLELKGRDARARQHCPARKLQGQEHLLKAVIGSQEKLIRNLINQINTAHRTEILGSRLSATSSTAPTSENETEKSAILEKEILALVNTLEAAIERHPAIYSGLKEQLLLEATHGKSNGILSAVLARHQLTTLGEHRPLSSSSADDTRNRSTRIRRKLVPYCADPKRHASQEDLRSLTTVGKSIGGSTTRDKTHPRPPTPAMHFPTFCPDEVSGPLALRPVLSMKGFLGPPLSPRRPATSINEYSSRKQMRRGITQWAF